MSLNLMYSIREGVLGLRRARWASTLAVMTVAVTLILLGIFMIITLNVNRLVRSLKDRMTLEVFVEAGLSGQDTQRLEKRLLGIRGVETVRFISSEDALRMFREEFGRDPLNILGKNPLPASFQLKLKSERQSAEQNSSMIGQIEKLEGVDEVINHVKLFSLVNHYSSIVIITDIALFVFVILAAIILIANTLRLTILGQQRNIEIMSLVGATRGFIRRPYMVQGILQGGIGGILASAVVWLLTMAFSFRFPHFLEVPLYFFAFPFAFGLVLGYLGSRVGLNKFMLR